MSTWNIKIKDKEEKESNFTVVTPNGSSKFKVDSIAPPHNNRYFTAEELHELREMVLMMDKTSYKHMECTRID